MKRIVGIWDLARSGGTLGRLLILLEELQIQRRIHDAIETHLVVIHDAAELLAHISDQRASASQSGIRHEAITATLAVLRAISGVTASHVWSRETIGTVMRLVESDSVLWPDPQALVRGAHNYDTTRSVQNYFAKTRDIPRLSVEPSLLAWAKDYFAANAGSSFPIAVHLKNAPTAGSQGNAKMESWLAFMEHCQRRHAAHFVLIGGDPVDPRFSQLSNVAIARLSGASIEHDLAIIQSSDMFMGMMSGPANMALFGTNPYVIFKNPEHHAAEMLEELGDRDHYPFAMEHQQILRVHETPENLFAAFERAIRPVTIQ